MLREVYLVAQEWCWSIEVKVGVEAKWQHFTPQHILTETTKPVGSFATMPHELWHRGKGAKLDHVIQLHCREKRTHPSYKAIRTWENLNTWGSKMIFLSDKLWLIANHAKSLANLSKTIIRNNLGFCNHSEFTLSRTFKNIATDLMV